MISERLAAGSWAPSGSFQTTPPEVPRQLQESVSYKADDPLRVWQAWLPMDQLPEDQPLLMDVNYEEAIYSDSQGALRFPFYQAAPSPGKIEINKRYAHTDSSASLSLALPTT